MMSNSVVFDLSWGISVCYVTGLRHDISPNYVKHFSRKSYVEHDAIHSLGGMSKKFIP